MPDESIIQETQTSAPKKPERTIPLAINRFHEATVGKVLGYLKRKKSLSASLGALAQEQNEKPLAREQVSRLPVSALIPRPADIMAAIDGNYNIQQEGPIYYETGRPEYAIGGIDTTELIEALLQEPQDGPLHILDIGTANGSFLTETSDRFGEKVTVHGLSARDFRTEGFPLDIDYKLGNAEHLLEIKDPSSQRPAYAPESLDLIVSDQTIKHFGDPMGVIVQMYEALKVGGVMLLDGFSTPGIMDNFPAIISQLQNQGYEIVAHYDYQIRNNNLHIDQVSSLAIRKTHKHLPLPIFYNGVRKTKKLARAEYVMSSDIQEKRLVLPQEMSTYVAKASEVNPLAKEGDYFVDGILFRKGYGTGTHLNNLDDAFITVNQSIQGSSSDPEQVRRLQELRDLLPAAFHIWKTRYYDEAPFRADVKQKLHIGVPAQKILE